MTKRAASGLRDRFPFEMLQMQHALQLMVGTAYCTKRVLRVTAYCGLKPVLV